jgi:ABC-2 type transport system permease protein
MIANQFALIRRELWEHRSIYVTPGVVAVVMTLLIVTSYVAASGFKGALDLAIVGASNVGDSQRRAALMAFLGGLTVVFFIAMTILTIFYSLDSLYSERKDKSILFWRSLPITDAETVISKLLTAIVIIPLITFVVIVATHLVNLALASLFVRFQGGSPSHLIWGSAPIFDVWATLLIVLVAAPVWVSPFIGWFLFVSAWTKRSPLLMAFLPLIVLPMLEFFVFRTTFLWQAIGSRSNFANMPLFSGIDVEAMLNEHGFEQGMQNIHLLGTIDFAKFFSSPSMWVGLVVCALLTTAAIYVRRYRDES